MELWTYIWCFISTNTTRRHTPTNDTTRGRSTYRPCYHFVHLKRTTTTSGFSHKLYLLNFRTKASALICHQSVSVVGSHHITTADQITVWFAWNLSIYSNVKFSKFGHLNSARVANIVNVKPSSDIKNCPRID